jgi:hypothetical protein
MKINNISMAWGALRATISSASGYASWVSYVMQAMTFYYVSNMDIPMWLFMTIIVTSVIVVLFGERKITIPAAYKFMNKQTWDNDNPTRIKLEEHDKKLDLIMEKLNITDSNSLKSP